MLKRLIWLCSITLLSYKVTGEKGFVKNQILDAKFRCSSSLKQTFKVASETQCAHRCLRKENCGILNYKERFSYKGEEGNCEIYSLDSSHGSCTIDNNESTWKAIMFQRQIQPKPKVIYKSCKEIFANTEDVTSGVYELQDGKHFCRMDNIAGCGAGGWTLAMKIDGSIATFTADADYWTNDVTYNTIHGLTSFESGEAKFPAFSKVPFDAICVGMKYAGRTNWLRIPYSRSSLKDIFQTGTYVQVSVSRATWKSLIGSDSSLQINCNRQGFNVRSSSGTIFCRIGFLANQEDDCVTPDSTIGFGLIDRVSCSLHQPPISCGNFASCSPDNGDKVLSTMGFILLQ